jgi:Flp pilus assembly protein TadB
MSDLVTVMLLGAGFGAGLFVVARSLRRRPATLTERISYLQRPGRPVTAEPRPRAGRNWDGYRDRVGIAGVRLLEASGLVDLGALRQQLRVLDKPIERHAYEKLLAGVALLALPNVMIGVLTVGGHPIAAVYGLGLGAVLGVGGFVYPDYLLSGQVTARRQAFRHALSSYLDLVTIALAGGAGTESALRGAAEAGGGWAFAEIRTALTRAELTGITPWQSFDELGATLGVDELRELAASMSLAGELGAKVRQSLVARADSLRAQQAAAIEAEAEANTERMIGPAVMVLGLTLFIFYGALGAIHPGTTIDTGSPAPTPSFHQSPPP